MSDWLTSLKTETPQLGFELAITLARKGVAYTHLQLISGKNYVQSILIMMIALRWHHK
jgi:hypothetical protein